jgi:hypothetical protein
MGPSKLEKAREARNQMIGEQFLERWFDLEHAKNSIS